MILFLEESGNSIGQLDLKNMNFPDKGCAVN